MYFVVDSSYSVPFLHFQSVKHFLKLVTRHLSIDDNYGFKVGLIDFGGRATGNRLMPLSKWKSGIDLENSIDSMYYFGNEGNLTNAIGRLVQNQVFSIKDGHRLGALPVVVLISSSPYEDSLLMEQKLSKLKALNYRMFFLLIKFPDVKKIELTSIADGGFIDIHFLPHWDHLSDNVNLLLDYLTSVL